MSINEPGTGETPSKKGTILSKISQELKDTFAMSNQKEAWNSFSEEAKKEMLESLQEQANFDLYSIDLSDICFSDVSRSRGDFPRFQDGVVQKDEIGNYIMINGMKCREWQPGISGFTYKDINDRYHALEWLEIGFCDKGKYTTSITTNNLGKLEPVKLPDGIDEELGGPFYDTNLTLKTGPLSNIKRDNLYEENWHEKDADSDKDYMALDLSQNWEKTDEGYVLNINGVQFKPFKKGVSGFVYKELNDEKGTKIFLAEYKDGKMVGKGLILGHWEKTYIATKKQN